MFENPSLQGTVVLWLLGSCLTCTFPIQHPLGCESKTLVVQATGMRLSHARARRHIGTSSHARSSCLAAGCGTVDLDQHCTPHHSINKLRRTREQHYYSTVVVEGRRSWCTGMYSRQKTLSKQQHPSKRYVPPAPAEGPIWIWPWDYCGQDRALDGRLPSAHTASCVSPKYVVILPKHEDVSGNIGNDGNSLGSAPSFSLPTGPPQLVAQARNAPSASAPAFSRCTPTVATVHTVQCTNVRCSAVWSRRRLASFWCWIVGASRVLGWKWHLTARELALLASC
jgi:hypothetical protein